MSLKNSVRTAALCCAMSYVLASCGVPDAHHADSELMSGPTKFLTKQEVRQLIIDAGFIKDEIPIMTCIAWAESSFDAWALSYAGARGLFQIMPFHAGSTCLGIGVDDLWDAHSNAQCAFKVYLAQGFDAWDPYYFAQRDPSSIHAQQYIRCMNGDI